MHALIIMLVISALARACFSGVGAFEKCPSILLSPAFSSLLYLMLDLITGSQKLGANYAARRLSPYELLRQCTLASSAMKVTSTRPVNQLDSRIRECLTRVSPSHQSIVCRAYPSRRARHTTPGFNSFWVEQKRLAHEERSYSEWHSK
jgi:hypothetical protein